LASGNIGKGLLQGTCRSVWSLNAPKSFICSRATICYDGENHYLGTFDTKQEAALAYDREARQRGQNKLLNYESIAAAEEAAQQAHDAHTLAHPKPRPSSGFYGVTASGKRWRAQLKRDGKRYFLGTFATKQEAPLAYDREARQRGTRMALNYRS
jgi:hypothetical protein